MIHLSSLNFSLLSFQGFKRLYSAKDIDRKKELRKLNHSVLVNFLDIIDILIKCPESPKREEKIEEINLLFIHMHHLINEFRPHQARETLRVMLMVQRRKRTQFTAKFKEQLEKVETIIQEAIENLPEADSEGVNASVTGDLIHFLIFFKILWTPRKRQRARMMRRRRRRRRENTAAVWTG